MILQTVLVVTVVAVTGVLTGCGDDTATAPATTTSTTTSTSSPTTSTTARPALDPILADLCGVLNAAQAGEIELVRSTFDHGPLHTLADEVIDIDRSVGARLLVAKEAVEAALANETIDPSDLAVDLDTLVAATAEALTVTGTPMTTTCTEETP